MPFLLLGSDGPPGFWVPSRSKPFNEHAVEDGNDGLSGVVEPPSGNVSEYVVNEICNQNHGTSDKGLSK